VEVAYRTGGVEAALKLAKERAGGQFDPDLAATVITHGEEILAGLDSIESWEAVISAEPALWVTLTRDQAELALTGVADFIDLKSPYTLGHARAVADLVTAAGDRLDLTTDELALLRHAGLAHGFGRLGVSNAIWDKQGRLAAGEIERVRMHPYLTERMLGQSAWLAPFGAIAGQLRERLDGSGYPRGLKGGSISLAARVLAAADVYQAVIEPRPHRAARPPDDAATELRA